MTKKRIGLLAVFLPLVLLVALYCLTPGLFVQPLVQANRALSDLSAHQVEVGDHTIHYLEGGSGDETLVLLHGIFAEKDHWVEFARPLSEDYHLIIPDIPGFGESTRLPEASYHYGDQVQRLHAFLEKLGQDRFHLAGNSMGGGIAARYALQYPEQIQSLAFIGAPHGIDSPIQSEMDRLLASGEEAPLIVKSHEDFDALMDFVFVDVPYVPYPLYQHFSTHAVSRAESNDRLWHRQQGDPFYMQDHLDVLKSQNVPVLTLWGDQDKLFHRSGVKVLEKHLPEGEHRVMEDTGHLPMMEHPWRTAEFYRAFLESQ